MAQKRANAVRFDDKLVLNRYMLRLFEVRDFEALAGPLRDPALEGLTEDGAHRYLGALNLLWDRTELPRALLRELDGRLVAHTRALNERRPAPVVWKYFQYLALLFAEVYLERYFRDPGGLRDGLNEELARANADLPKAHRLPDYEPDDLRRLAFWNATGSGKTLLMHVNILQYRARLAAAGRERELNRTILLTPNEGLSRQHLAELAAAGIAARPFRPDAPAGLYDRDAVDVLEVTKLREEAGEKTVAVGAFGGDNLVLVDEGHRGAGSSKDTGWMTYRNRLSESGFAFEYSATFGQAVKGNRALEAAYGKAVLFDYSYKRFYRDGFGKDYRILNLADEKGGEGKGGEGKGAEPGADGERRALYLTACLLTFYQQAALFAARPAAFRPFLLERPLWVFVGASVNAVRTRRGRKVSDVLDVLLFLDGFARGGPAVVARIERLLGGAPGLLDGRGREIFAEAFPYLAGLGRTADQTHADVLRTVFNAPAGAALHVERLKGADGELALRLGGNPPFGVINVGDAATLRKLCEGRGGLVVTDRAIGGSLFAGLADGASSVNVLIGSKKFTEGWNSWRVGTMGLMNVGRSEGPEVVQLFGRGVRLRGKDMTLKRSSRLPFGGFIGRRAAGARGAVGDPQRVRRAGGLYAPVPRPVGGGGAARGGGPGGVRGARGAEPGGPRAADRAAAGRQGLPPRGPGPGRRPGPRTSDASPARAGLVSEAGGGRQRGGGGRVGRGVGGGGGGEARGGPRAAAPRLPGLRRTVVRADAVQKRSGAGTRSGWSGTPCRPCWRTRAGIGC